MTLSALPPARQTAQRDALLALTQLLATANPGVFGEALDLVLGGLGASKGIAYEASGAGFDAVAHRGLPGELRDRFAHVSIDTSWALVQRALKHRKLTAERDAAGARESKESDALGAAQWKGLVVAPIALGRDVVGFFVIATGAAELSKESQMFVETLANVLALGISKKRAASDDPSRELRAAQLAAVGMIAVGFADDMREPLGALTAQLETMSRRYRELRRRLGSSREFDQLEDTASDALAAVERAETIRNRLLGAVRESPPEPLHLVTIARDAMAILSSRLRERGVLLEPRFEGEPSVLGRREELTQLLLHLILNAADAIESKDQGSSRAPSTNRRVLVGVRADGSRAVLSVEDSGAGIPPEVRARMFDAFYTTKRAALGLGLTLAKQIALAHRGHIETSAGELGGALVRVTLPALRATQRVKIPKAPPKPQAEAPRASPKTLLWIDDDGLFLRSIKRALRDWDVRTARTAGEAEQMLLASPEAPLRIFCDVGLPDRGGHELHRDVAEKRPDLARRFVFVTGGAITSDVADYLVGSACPTLLKPIRVDEVEGLLDRGPSSPPAEPEAIASPPTERTKPESAAPPSRAAGPDRRQTKRLDTAQAAKPTVRLRRAKPADAGHAPTEPAPPPRTTTTPPKRRDTVTLPSIPQAKRPRD